MALMRAVPNWERFIAFLNRAFPKKPKSLPLPYGDDCA